MGIETPALGVTLDTRELDDVVADAISLLETRLPEWIARNGAPEVIYLEAVAQAASEIATAADLEVGAVVEAILATLYQVPRLPGTVASGEVTLTFDTVVATTIPLGTRFALRDYGIDLLVTEATDVSTASTVDLPVETSVPTADVNGVGAEAAVDLLDAIPNALSASVSTALAGGSSAESDSAYIDRARNRLARVTSSLVVGSHFSAYVLEDGRASNAATVEAWDGADIGTAGTDGSYVTVVTYGRGAQLTSTVRDELAAAMQDITAAGVTVAVNEADLVTVDVTAEVAALSGYSSVTVQAACETALQTYLAPETWEFGDTVRVTTLTALLANVAGVDYVVSVTEPATDSTLLADQLAQYGTLSITVS